MVYPLSSSFGCLETQSGMYGSRRKGQANLRDVSHLLFGGVGGIVVDGTGWCRQNKVLFGPNLVEMCSGPTGG